jgi:CheY-like chemotaxis protein
MSKWIVMVDDDLDMHFIYQRVFQRLGLVEDLKLFENGKSALEYLNANAHDVKLIFSDINMPVMDGLELRSTINNDVDSPCRAIPFIYLSTSAREKEVQAAYDLLVQGFFQKGGTIDELERIIRIVVEYWGQCRVPEPHSAGIC